MKKMCIFWAILFLVIAPTESAMAATRRADIRVELSKDQQVHFHLNGAGGVSIHMLTVNKILGELTEGKQEEVWAISPNRIPARQTEVVYGVVPAGFEEIVPAAHLEVGALYKISITGDAIGSLYFRITSSGEVVEVKKPPRK